MLLHTKSLCYALTLALFLGAGIPAHAQEGGAMPPAAISALTLSARPLPVVSELPGRIAATRVSEVRARVSGILQQRIFEQGS
ncbi:efflux transporter periplasmic adaptor subunit, partial [Rhizobium ruizarguesonis]